MRGRNLSFAGPDDRFGRGSADKRQARTYVQHIHSTYVDNGDSQEQPGTARYSHVETYHRGSSSQVACETQNSHLLCDG